MPDRWSPRLGRLALAAAIVASAACATTPERLPELDRRFYYNLPTPQDQEEFLRLPDEERQAFLESKGLWSKWTALPAEEREAAGKGEIQVGFHEFAVFMAWGPPADSQTRDRNDRPILVHTFIRCSSGPKAGRYVRNNLDCDGTSTEREVAIRDGLVAEIIYER